MILPLFYIPLLSPEAMCCYFYILICFFDQFRNIYKANPA